MRDTIIIAPKKSVIKEELPFVRTVISSSDFVSSSLDPNVKFIIKIDKGVKPSSEQLTALRENASDDSITVGIHEKADFFATPRRFIYSFAGIKESDSVGAVIFPASFAELTKNASAFDTVRLLALANDEKHNVKRIVMLGSDKRKFSLNSLRYIFSVFLSSKILKYVFSSGVAFIIDYVLLLALNKVIPVASLEIGAFIAWCVSSFVNFTINRKFVFTSSVSLKTSLIEYYSLAGVVFLIKTYVFIELMTRVLSIPLAIAKPCAEVILFIINYFIQKKLIFGKRNKKSDQTKSA